MNDRETPPPPEPLAYYARGAEANVHRYPPEPLGVPASIAIFAAAGAIAIQSALCGGVARMDQETLYSAAIFTELGMCAVATLAGAVALFTTRHGSRGRRAAGWGLSVGLVLGTLAGFVAYLHVTGIAEYVR